MRVLLVYPQILEHGTIPIALTVLASVLRTAGHEVRVFNCSQYVSEADIQSVQESYCMFEVPPAPPVCAPPFRGLENLERDLIDTVREFKAHIVGVTATSGTYQLGLKCSRFIKKHCRDITVVFGGMHPTICPEEVILEDSVDIVCIGEGEDALLELCQTMEEKRPFYDIRNLWLKDRNKPGVIYKNPLRPLKNLDTLPPLDFSDFHEYEFYRPLGGNIYKMLNTEVSRGCIFNCYYCTNHFLHGLLKGTGNYHRKKNPEIAVRHLKELKERYHFNAVRFWDEDFTVFPVTYLKELSSLYKKEIGLPFIVYAGTRTVTEEKVKCLKEMGCITMAMAIESGNYWVRKYLLNRDISDEDIIKKYEIVKKSGIRVSAYNMIGLPFETRQMVFDTIYLNRRVRPETSSVSVYLPYPKTRLAEIAKEFGFLKGATDYISVYSPLNSPYLSQDEVNGLVRTFALYTKLPKYFFPLLERCEKDESLAKKLFPILSKYLKTIQTPVLNRLRKMLSFNFFASRQIRNSP